MLSGLRYSQFNAVTGRLNQRILRLTQAGSNWAWAAIRIGIFMFAIGVLWLPLLILWRVSVLGPMPEVSIELGLIYILGIVVFSPVTETLLLVLIHRLIRRRLGLTGFVFVTAALAAAAHAPLKSLPPIDAAVGFAIMAYQYVSFRERLGFGRAFWGVALAHGTNNGIAVILLLVIDFF